MSEPTSQGMERSSAVPVIVESSPRPGDYFRVAVSLVLRNPASLALFVSGPALWAFGAATGSDVVIDLGQRMSWLVALVPAFALLVGSYTAFRPGSSALYVKTRWSFAESGIEIDQASRRARAEWTEFSKWREAGGCYLLHTSARHYVVIATRDVPGDVRARFEALLEARIGGRRG